LAEKDLTFGSPAELADMLEEIGLRLHSKNRIGGGESQFLWMLAEAIRSTGRLARLSEDRTELDELYGDGYEDGTLSGSEQLAHFNELLWKRPTEKD
jgi:hypothetical protein